MLKYRKLFRKKTKKKFMLVYILFVLGFILLVKAADWLVDGASNIASRLKVSDLVIGLTVVAFGTSAPELVVNVMAAFRGSSELAIANILGSNISNVLLILGVSAIIYPLTIKKKIIRYGIPFNFLAILILGVLVNDTLFNSSTVEMISRGDALVLISFFLIFLYQTFFSAGSEFDEMRERRPHFAHHWIKDVFRLIFGVLGLTLGARWIVDGALQIADIFQISESVIGLTIVAIGTSLPELAASAMAAYKKKSDIAVGNILGSNLFNIFWILGASALINPLQWQPSLNFDIIVNILVIILLFVFVIFYRPKELSRWQGVTFLFLYFFYLLYQFLLIF